MRAGIIWSTGILLHRHHNAGCFLDPYLLFERTFGASWADLGAQKLIFEGLALTLEVAGVTLAVFELQFSSPWGHLRESA